MNYMNKHEQVFMGVMSRRLMNLVNREKLIEDLRV